MISSLETQTIMYPSVGSLLNGRACSFTVWAPFRKKVEVILKDQKIARDLTKSDGGYWHDTVEGIDPGSRYVFRLDGEKELPDPASRAQPEGVHGPSAVVEKTYPWTDSSWKGLALGDMILYELHVGTFTPDHDFKGVISRLPYLKTLGVNAIELMPVAQFPGNRNWGYDGVFPFAVQASYGGPLALKALVNEAHQQEMAVILDVVYNHVGPEGNYLSAYGPYFTDKYKTAWGEAVNFDDAWCDGVRGYYLQNALMWLDEFHVDGLRLDAVHAIWDSSARHFIEELALSVAAFEKECGRKKVLIAELDLNKPKYIAPVSKGGYGLDGQWTDEFHHALHALLTGESNGYYEDFGTAEHMARALTDSYVYTGQYSVHRKKHFGRAPAGATYDQFVVFAQNHDQVGNRMLGERLTALVSKEALKLAAAAYLLAPQVPMLFMGEEYGEKNPFQYFVSHSDPDLVELVRKGRSAEFIHFKWQGDVPDPQSEKTFNRSVLSWNLENDPDARMLFSFYRYLIEFRKNRSAMHGKTPASLNLLSWQHEVICFERVFANDYLLIVLNFSKEKVSFALPGKGNLKRIFDSASRQWGGPAGEERADTGGAGTIQLHAESAQIFER